MTQTALQLLTLDDFIARYGDNERYELIDGAEQIFATDIGVKKM